MNARGRFAALAAGALLAAVPYLMAATVSGYPSRPTFSAVTVRDAGAVSIGTSTATLTVNGVALTPSTGTGTLTITGCTVAQTPAYRYAKVGNIVVLSVDSWSCTSNSTGTTGGAGQIPAAIRPTTASCVVTSYGIDNTANFKNPAMLRIASDGSFNLDITGGTSCAGAGWTAAGTKGMAAFNATYTLQ